MKEKLSKGTLDNYWRNPNHWRANLIYNCSDDPRIVVPKKLKWLGWTLNFAHPSAWFALAVCLAYIVTPIIVLAKMGLINSWIFFVTITFLILLTIGLSVLLSSTKRYEQDNY